MIKYVLMNILNFVKYAQLKVGLYSFGVVHLYVPTNPYLCGSNVFKGDLFLCNFL